MEEIRLAIGAPPASRLRHLLRDAGVPLHPLVEGVRQDSEEALERTLAAMGDVYETGSLEVRRRCRDEVIAARQHALWALARLEGEARLDRERMRQTMLVWLENPPLFRAWAEAKRKLRAANP